MRATPESGVCPPPHSPSGEGAVEVSSRESPLPRRPGSGFPKREALTTHRLGDGICRGSQGLGPGRLGGGEERDRDRDVGREEREVQKGKRRPGRRRQRDTERRRIKKDRSRC